MVTISAIVISLIVITIMLLAIKFNSIFRNPRIKIHKENRPLANEAFRIIHTGFVDRLEVSFVKNSELYASEDHFVYKSSDMGMTFRCLGHFNKVNPSFIKKIKDKIARNPVVRRIRKTRGTPNIVVLNSGTIIIIYDHIYRSDDNGKSFHPVFTVPKEYYGPLTHGYTICKNGNIYFGEYNCNKRPHIIKVLKGSDDGRNWSVCFTFEKGKIFHIHSITYDEFRDRLWICTGDRDNESYLFYTDNDFKNLSLLGGGDQDWRICSLIITKDFLYWCSDNDVSGSSICRWSFENRLREKLIFIGKPSYHSTCLKDGTLVFSTTYEPDSQYTKNFNPKPSTEIWISKNGIDWFKIIDLDYKESVTPYGKSRPQIVFPAGDHSAICLFFTPWHTKQNMFSIQRYFIEWK